LKLDVGSWKGEQFKGRKVIKITDVFDVMKGKPERNLYMDIKNVDLKQLSQEVKSRGIDKQVILASTKYEIHREWKELVPDSQTLLWMGAEEKKLQERIDELIKYDFAGITQLQIHVYPKQTSDAWAPPTDASGPENPFRLRDAFLREIGHELRAHGVVFQTFPYTEDPAVYAKLLDLGVMSFATDHPDVTMREIKAYYEKRRASQPVRP